MKVEYVLLFSPTANLAEFEPSRHCLSVILIFSQGTERLVDVGAVNLSISKAEISENSNKAKWRDLNLIENLPSVWWNIFAALMPFPTASHFFGLKTGIIHSLFIFVILVPCTWLLHRTLRIYARTLRSPLRELLITLGYFSVASAAALASYTSLYNSSHPNFYSVTTFLIYPLFSWGITIGISLQARVMEQEAHVKKIRDDLVWAVARVNLIDWFNGFSLCFERLLRATPGCCCC